LRNILNKSTDAFYLQYILLYWCTLRRILITRMISTNLNSYWTYSIQSIKTRKKPHFIYTLGKYIWNTDAISLITTSTLNSSSLETIQKLDNSYSSIWIVLRRVFGILIILLDWSLINGKETAIQHICTDIRDGIKSL